MKKILIIDDDKVVSENLAFLLEFSGYKMFQAANGNEGLDLYSNAKPDLIILDINLPGINGYDLLKIIRKTDLDIKIIIYTGIVSDALQLKSLESLADDYLVKPTAIEILRARIKNALKHKRIIGKYGTFRTGDLLIDFDNKFVKLKNEFVEFSILEYKILELLATHAGSVCEYDYLLFNAWSRLNPGTKETLKEKIKIIRQKLGDDPSNPKLIECIHDRGYILNRI
ncbi:MAG: operon transcriptional regulatory protein KdpE [Ignavibacteria bacterium]|nr:operon transcriptional regulatory protein KdpE [Ignavibacteria bacterium]